MRQGTRIARIAAALALALAALALAACGSSSSSSSSSGPDPASVVPANAPLYGDFVVKPEGDQKDALESFLEKVSGRSDVGAQIINAFDQQSQQDGITYEDDIEPWLGSKVAGFATTLGPNSSGAAVAPTSDPDAAMAAFEKGAKASPQDGTLEHSSYKGVDYDSQGDTSFGIVGGFVVAGTNAAFRAAVDASTGSSLADASDYRTALTDAPADRLGTVYADPRAIVQAVVQSGGLPASQADSILQQMGADAGQPVAGWLDATSSSIGLTFSAATPSNAPASSPSLIDDLPADAWLAFGAASVGQGFQRGLEQLQAGAASAGVPGLGHGDLLGQISAKTGIDVENVGKWLTSVSGYFSGTSVFSLGGALVLGTSDQDASSQTLSEVENLLRKDPAVAVSSLGGGEQGFKVVPNGTPVEIDVEQADGKIVVGLGQGSVQSVLSPGSTLGGADAFKSATGTLGDGITPSFYLDFQPIANLANLAQSSSPDPQLQQALPYLDRLDYLVAGVGQNGDRTESRIVLGVSDSGDSGSGVAAAVRP